IVIVIVTAIAMGVAGILGIVHAGIKHEETKIKLQAAASGADVANTTLATEVARLRDRVAILEKLITDDDRKLAGDIERLRRDNQSGLGA
ncbi:MAG: hypothetical protein ABI740_00920, partial [Alphaproteobacteria bacterium]